MAAAVEAEACTTEAGEGAAALLDAGGRRWEVSLKPVAAAASSPEPGRDADVVEKDDGSLAGLGTPRPRPRPRPRPLEVPWKGMVRRRLWPRVRLTQASNVSNSHHHITICQHESVRLRSEMLVALPGRWLLVAGCLVVGCCPSERYLGLLSASGKRSALL